MPAPLLYNIDEGLFNGRTQPLRRPYKLDNLLIPITLVFAD